MKIALFGLIVLLASHLVLARGLMVEVKYPDQQVRFMNS